MKRKKILLNANEIEKHKGISERIRRMMTLRGISSVVELEKIITIDKGRGYSPAISQLLYKIENSDSLYSPSCETLYVIADALNCSVDYLLGNTDIINSNMVIDELIGISPENIEILKQVSSAANNYTMSSAAQSGYYDNPYFKVLKMLNFIIERINVKNANEDFLTVLYKIVMLDFVCLNSDEFESLIEQAKSKTDDHDIQHVLDRILQTATVSFDVQTGDKAPASSFKPNDALKDNLINIINSWKNEYEKNVRRRRGPMTPDYVFDVDNREVYETKNYEQSKLSDFFETEYIGH